MECPPGTWYQIPDCVTLDWSITFDFILFDVKWADSNSMAPRWQFELQCFRMQGSFAPVRVLYSAFDGSKILLPFAQKNLRLLQTEFSFTKVLKSSLKITFTLRFKLRIWLANDILRNIDWSASSHVSLGFQICNSRFDLLLCYILQLLHKKSQIMRTRAISIQKFFWSQLEAIFVFKMSSQFVQDGPNS